MTNQNPEQIARDNIDKQLLACGWVVQSKSKINLSANLGVAVREYQTDVGPADYVLFVSGKPLIDSGIYFQYRKPIAAFSGEKEMEEGITGWFIAREKDTRKILGKAFPDHRLTLFPPVA
jgi:hypothetical protein